MLKRMPLNRLLLAITAGLLLCSAAPASAESQLPPCPSTRNFVWNMCQGEHSFNSGARYVGEFKNDKFHGQGTYTHSNGGRYVGEFRGGLYQGQGTYTYPSGQRYVGEWRENQRHGPGTLTFPSGARYVGEFRDDQRSGQGTYAFSNGRSYVGEWRDDKLNGQGSVFSPDRQLLQNGLWRDGVLVQANDLPNPVSATQGASTPSPR